MKKKPTVDYTPIKISDDEWSIDPSFVTHWLIRGDIEKISDKYYLRIKDDNYLKDHLKGHKYKVR